MADPVNFLPGEVNFSVRSGNDVTFTITFPYNTTGGTHQMLLGLSKAGMASTILVSGSGLVVTPGASTVVQVTVPAALTLANQTLYYDYNLTMSFLLKTKMFGRIEMTPGQTAT